MRKSILLISGVGIGAGVLYALTRGSKSAASENNESANGEAQQTANRNGQNGQSRAANSGVSNIDSRRPQPFDGQQAASMKPAPSDFEVEPEIDDRGTGQHQASLILKSIRDAAFEASDEKLALALGRPTEEIEAWTSGDGTIDGDVVMKARMLADKRGVEIQ